MNLRNNRKQVQPPAQIRAGFVLEKKMLTVSGAAKWLSLHEETVRLKARTGQIPAHKKHGQWYFFEDELDEHIRSGNNAARQEAAHERRQSCPVKKSSEFTGVKVGAGGTTRLPHQTEKEYASMLKLKTSNKQKN
ncbi:helix-turn-helix domain-containing protein [Neisseria shayeganii]|uniref:helix-turn-helix domain-containing protein n=1 Tax=Neisseria shayeganii TaxID=607712 RepID=UPI000A0237B6|nr:helix-turn-helix domain-containing protein [Neisseria shayeganii]